MRGHGAPWLRGFSGWPSWKGIAGSAVKPIGKKQACFTRWLSETR